MWFKELKQSLIFGLPHSKIIDTILSLRDPSLNFKYLTVYRQYYKKEFLDNLSKDENVIKLSEYIFPLFSFNGLIYYLYKNKEDIIFDFLAKHDTIVIEEVPSMESMFYNMRIPKKELETRLLGLIAHDVNLIRYFVEHFKIK